MKITSVRARRTIDGGRDVHKLIRGALILEQASDPISSGSLSFSRPGSGPPECVFVCAWGGLWVYGKCPLPGDGGNETVRS
ncbi:hypothetical protein ZHAS_00011692 [Anopheles sinensis]|uniref:Uncharacterized protein n=1 Tax=Anopheles sinensis TaxID=74873 RepID=A0A084W0U9_ANOSI|nr:hypothetical protein ZHAS_00011692 [Anopheles sinensis]